MLEIAICTLTVSIVLVLCYFTTSFLSYRSDALILMLTVSVLAMFYDMIPVLVAATISALGWNLLFIPPTFTFHIGNTEDSLLFLMYFVIALVNVVLVTQIKKEQKKLRKKEEEAMVIKLYNTVLNSLSHELKTPLTIMRGELETALLENDFSPAQKEMLLSQVDEIERLARIVDGLTLLPLGICMYLVEV